MKTHGEVQAAIDAGEILQIAWSSGWEDISSDQAGQRAPCELRIKPKPVERLEGWAYEFKSDIFSLPPVRLSLQPPGTPLAPTSYTGITHLREVRPGDLTREEVEEKVRQWAAEGNYGDGIEQGNLWRILLGEQ